ncbi:MAG: hypothetical protein R2766_10785 [Saprospiraceae bacterium]
MRRLLLLILSSHSAFLKNDGTIVGTDGTSLPSLKNAGASNAIVAVWHRNHLPIRTAIALPTDEKILICMILLLV